VASAEAKNLEAIAKAIDQHNANCPFPAAEVRMNPFEVERLGWEEIRGLPIVPDAEIGTGRFRIVCSRDLDGEGIEEVEAVGQEIETVIPPTTEGRSQTFQNSIPSSESQRWASTLSWVSSPVQIRTPIAIRIAPPRAMIAE
jgi:hypothetical protein